MHHSRAFFRVEARAIGRQVSELAGSVAFGNGNKNTVSYGLWHVTMSKNARKQTSHRETHGWECINQ